MEEKEVQLKDCVECGTQFKPNSSRQKYCSGKCSDKVYNRKRRESVREFSRQWRKDNSERAHATAKEYRETHKKEERARGRRWWLRRADRETGSGESTALPREAAGDNEGSSGAASEGVRRG